MSDPRDMIVTACFVPPGTAPAEPESVYTRRERAEGLEERAGDSDE